MLRTAILCLPLASGCGLDGRELGPLLGHWTTADPRFEGCAVDFRDDGRILFQQVDGERELLVAVKVTMAPARSSQVFQILCEDTGGEESLLSLALDDGGCMRMGRQDEVTWQRSEEPR